MNAPCSEFRADYLARLLGDEEPVAARAALPHVGGCASCASWAARQVALSDSLAGLPARPAPAELDDRVAEAVGSVARARRRTGEALAGLPRQKAPVALDRLVARAAVEAGAERSLETSQGARLVRTLSRLEAPFVLARLVDEELRAPEAASARRTVGDLPRMAAPRLLRPRVAVDLAHAQAPPSGSISRRRWLPRAGLAAAAALLALVGGSRFFSSPDAVESGRSYRFEVTTVTSLDQMPDAANARLWANALTGGAFQVIPSAPLASDRLPEGTPR